MRKPVAIILARAPRLGAVKRRLAREIGDRAALRFHQNTLVCLARALAADRSFTTIIALTPDRARLRLKPRSTAQGHGDLGMRMARVFAKFPGRRVALLGCDIPQANALDVRAALRGLGTADAVFGPAEDGGYWLIAMGPRRPARPFDNVRWSTPYALADTMHNYRHHRVGFIRRLSDVDDAADYYRAMRT